MIASLQVHLVSCAEGSCVVCVAASCNSGLGTGRGEERMNRYTGLSTSSCVKQPCPCFCTYSSSPTHTRASSCGACSPEGASSSVPLATVLAGGGLDHHGLLQQSFPPRQLSRTPGLAICCFVSLLVSP